MRCTLHARRATSGRVGASKRFRRAIHLAAGAAALAVPTLASAGVAWNSGAATWSWDADTNSTLGGKTTFTIAPPSSGSMPTSPTFQLNRNGSSGTSTATGRGSIGYVANPTTATFTFAGGSGAAQNDPTNTLTGQTITKVQYGGLFNITGSNLGPTASGYFSVAVAGTAGVGGSAGVNFNVQFRLNGPSGALLRPSISVNETFSGGASPQAFSKVYTFSQPFSPSTIGTGNQVWIGGDMTLTASNFGSPSDIIPLLFESGSAPPTATFYAGTGSASLWNSPASWNDPGAGITSFVEPGANIPTVPNAPGTRARIVNFGDPAELIVDQPTTIGALHIERDAGVFISSPGLGLPLIFDDTSGAGATIFVGNAVGTTGGVEISNPVQLADPLEIRSESRAALTEAADEIIFNGPIGLASGSNPQPVTVRGRGTALFNAGNSYDGPTLITDDGTLNANAPGSLGAGTVTADGGRLNLNNGSASTSASTPMFARNNGQINLGFVPAPGNRFNIAGSGVISGSPAELEALDAGPTGNLQLLPGAVIGHESFDIDPAVGNPQNLALKPLYIFGVSADLTAPTLGSITIGTASGGPWRGIGGDRGDRTLGNPNVFGAGLVNVAGEGELFSAEGTFRMLGPITGAASAVLNIRGRGTVATEGLDSPYAGSFVVLDGATLRVNGDVAQVSGTTVQPGGTLGGDGVLGGLTQVQAGGVLDPGRAAEYDNVTGSLEVTNLTLLPGAILHFEFGGDVPQEVNDNVLVASDLVLDGELIVNQLQGFDRQDTYTLFTFGGQITDNGLEISPMSQEIFGTPAPLAARISVIPNPGGTGGIVVLTIPEPSMLAVAGGLLGGLAVRRRRR